MVVFFGVVLVKGVGVVVKGCSFGSVVATVVVDGYRGGGRGEQL